MFFSLSKTSFLKPNTNIQHKNNIINMESTYLVQPIVNGKKSCSCTSQTLHKPQVFTEKTTTVSHQIFICSVISFFLSLWNYTSFSEITFTFIWFETKKGFVKKQSLNSTDNLQTTGFHWEDHNCLPSNFYLQWIISFFSLFSEITFTFMWWEKQGKVYVGTLKAAATSKSGSALPK